MALAGEIVRYLVTGKGMLTYSASLAAASVKVLEESATPDVQCSIAPGSFKDGQIGELDDFPGITAGAWQMRPLSRGYVEAKSNDPREAPAINPRYLSEQTDRRAIIGGLRFVRRLFAAPALAKYVGAEILPGAQVESDDELLDYARQKGSTVYHATCTCKMGSDTMAVVDDQLRVHGLERLRVIDASVMPAVTSTNTNAPTIMIAEKGAEMIRRAARATDTAPSAEPRSPSPARSRRHPLPRCGRGAQSMHRQAPLPHRGRGCRARLVGEGEGYSAACGSCLRSVE